MLLFSTIFCYLLLDFHVKTGTRFLLRDKRIFEISEVEITRVDYIKYKGSYPGKVTLTKHSLPGSSKEEKRFLFYDYNKYYFCNGLLARLLNG